MAKYNHWMNKKICLSSAQIDDAELLQDRGAFFQSVLGTLNHILVADILWLKRYATHPKNFSSLAYVRNLEQPSALDKILFSDLESLKTERDRLDLLIIDFTKELNEPDFDSVLDYTDTEGNSHQNQLGMLIQHLFNHQTHHRGQVTTLLNQIGIDVGATDLPVLVHSLNSNGLVDR